MNKIDGGAQMVVAWTAKEMSLSIVGIFDDLTRPHSYFYS